MCSAPNVYMFVYTLIGTHIVPLRLLAPANFCESVWRRGGGGWGGGRHAHLTLFRWGGGTYRRIKLIMKERKSFLICSACYSKNKVVFM